MKKTISKLKKELDKYFSLYIRIRDANEYRYGTMFYLWSSQRLQGRNAERTLPKS